MHLKNKILSDIAGECIELTNKTLDLVAKLILTGVQDDN